MLWVIKGYSGYVCCRADPADSAEGEREARAGAPRQVRQQRDPGPAHGQRQRQGRLRHTGQRQLFNLAF